MTHKSATDFLKGIEFIKRESTKWADLGCGNGTFTFALAEHIHTKSIIYAIDFQNQNLITNDTINIQFLKLDFEKENLPFDNLDGILMANSLHFIKNKPEFIKRLDKKLNETGQLVIVEYDTDSPNPWAPFPISFVALEELFLKLGYLNVIKIKERKSIYDNGKMYLSVITKVKR